MTKLLIKLFIKDSEKTDDPAVRSRYGTLSRRRREQPVGRGVVRRHARQLPSGK